jgi:hypothetical protein
MHDKPFSMKRFREASARGKKMAQARWKKDREKRAAWEAAEKADPLRVPGRILQRVVVITGEANVVEITRRDTTSARQWRQMKRRAGLV